MSDYPRPSPFERARSGDWEAYEEIVSATIAPTFDAAWLILGDADAAARVTEESLFELLQAVKSGAFRGGDTLRFTGRAVVRAARAAKSEPFASGLEPDDMAFANCPPNDPRRFDLGKLPASDRIAIILGLAMDLEPSDLAHALEVPVDHALAAADRALAAVPSHLPKDALRDMLDNRASRVRVPFSLEERVLDRFEAAGG